MKKVILIVLVLGNMNIANADTANANFNTSSTLEAKCIINVPNVDLGLIIPSTASSVSSTPQKMLVTCTKGTTFSLKINTGNGTYAQRYMTSSNGDKLLYQLYRTPLAASPVFGDGTQGTGLYNSGPATGNEMTFYYHLRFDRNQYVTPTNYSDSLTVTVEY